MAKVRVWNDNVHPYKELFKGDQISIGPKKFIEMDEEEANQFRGTFAPMVFDADGNDMPEGYKMIRIEKILADEVAPAPVVDDMLCLACSYKADSKADFAEHLKTHSDQVVVDEVAEKQLKAKKLSKGAA